MSAPLNGCGACGEDFGSVRLFDAHRVGAHEYLASPERPDGRRCLTVEEMKERGWQLNARGRWINPEWVDRARQAFAGRERDDGEATAA